MENKELETTALSIPDKARALKVINNLSYEYAGMMLVQIKSIRKQIDASYDPIIAAAHMAHKTAVAEKKRIEAPLATAEGIVKPAMAAWMMEQERIRQVEERRLQEVARKAEEERQIQAAIAAEAQGDKRAAEAVMAAPVYVPPVVVASTTPKVAGVSFQERWTYRIVDAGVIPREFMAPDTVKIGQYARAMKLAGRIPGVEIYSEKSVSGRG